MSRAFNFSSGPAMLPEAVLEQAREELLDWGSARASVMEISHRSKQFIAVAEEAEKDLRDLLAIPADYSVLFMQGGATTQFALLPLNLAGPEQSADYVLSGYWGQKAVKEAAASIKVNIAASSEAQNFADLPSLASYQLDPNAAFVHYTPNETIGGVEFHSVPETGAVPLLADMSSNLLSRPVDVSKHGVIYAGAQKNLGPAGLTVVIMRNDLLERKPRQLSNILTYAAHAKEGSMLNTPPTFSWYLCGLVFKWIKAQGGLTAMESLNKAKADLLYNYIDESGFYSNPVAKAARSRMNVPFRLADENLDEAFLKESAQAGLLTLKGHRVVGGMRASIYNAMPLQGVQALVDFMRDFAKRNG